MEQSSMLKIVLGKTVFLGSIHLNSFQFFEYSNFWKNALPIFQIFEYQSSNLWIFDIQNNILMPYILGEEHSLHYLQIKIGTGLCRFPKNS